MLKKRNSKLMTTLFCLLLLIMFPMTAYAEKASSGVRGCGGTHKQRNNKTEEQTTAYTLRNYNISETINITRIVIVNSNGIILFDGIPETSTFKSSLGPAQNTSFNTNDVLTSFLPKSERPMQTYIVWETLSGEPAEHLGGGHTTRVRIIATGAESARHGGSCRNLDL